MPRKVVAPVVQDDLTTTLELLPLADLRPHPRNDGSHPPDEIAHLKASLTAHGVYRNVVVAQDGTILAGHGVVQAATELGHTHIAGKRLPYGPDDPRALKVLVGDNHIARLRQQDDALLVELLTGLAADDPLALLGTGYDAATLAALAATQGPSKAGRDVPPQFERAEELREQWGTAVGQLWACGKHRIICGDCTEKTVVERLMQGQQPAMVLTSPPYAVGKDYEQSVSFVEHLAMLRSCADRCLEILVPGGFLFINFDEIAPQSHTRALTGSPRQCLYPISKDYWQIFHEERGCDLYAQRIWYKPFNRLQKPFWTYRTSIPHHQEWEHLWTWQAPGGEGETVENGVVSEWESLTTWRAPGGDGDRVYNWNASVRAVWDTRMEATSDKPLTRHSAAFPVGIPERALQAHTVPAALIYEPFLGSGTTLIACENLDRICYGCELDPGSVAVTLQRYADVTHEMPQRLG